MSSQGSRSEPQENRISGLADGAARRR